MDLSLKEFKLKKMEGWVVAGKLKSCHRELVFLPLKMWGVKKSGFSTQLLLIKKSRDFNERGHENTRINFV